MGHPAPTLGWPARIAFSSAIRIGADSGDSPPAFRQRDPDPIVSFGDGGMIGRVQPRGFATPHVTSKPGIAQTARGLAGSGQGKRSATFRGRESKLGRMILIIDFSMSS